MYVAPDSGCRVKFTGFTDVGDADAFFFFISQREGLSMHGEEQVPDGFPSGFSLKQESQLRRRPIRNRPGRKARPSTPGWDQN